MANVTSTTTSISIIMMTLNKPEQVAGASPGDKIGYVPYKQMNDASITIKENDWVVDEDSVTWVVKGWTEDPIRAAYALLLRKA
jgi:hypothetical protein